MESTPELPDITVYVERLRTLAVSQPLVALKVDSPFLLRTPEPLPDSVVGRAVTEIQRIGKRIVLGFEEEYFAVIHLMIAGRLKWVAEPRIGAQDLGTGTVAAQGGPQDADGATSVRRGSKVQGSRRPSSIATFSFPNGHLLMTEAGSKHRASLHLVRGRSQLAAFDRGGVSVLDSSPEVFAMAMRRENRTLKRALTDPSIVDGVGNAYSDEILHRARLSPFALTQSLQDAQLLRLHSVAVDVLVEWTERLRKEAGHGLPEKVTAFRPEMAVHGKYNKPCPECGSPIQRVVYADNEANYCPTCQTGGKLLADRGLSRLLKSDWPKTIEELEKLRGK